MAWQESFRTVSFRVDDEGRLVAAPGDARRLGLGLGPGATLKLETDDPLWVARRPVGDLARVYVEPTNACNLDCRTCVRNVWDEPSGWMTDATFERIVQGLRDFLPAPTVFFGGFGEPLAHPNIVEMVAQVKALGALVELITNGTLA